MSGPLGYGGTMKMEMNLGRRRAITGIGTGLLAMVLGRAEPPPAPRRVVLNRCNVAGFRFHQGIEVRDQIREGDELDVVRESENPHDRYAVALRWRGRHIGYVPRDENRHLSRMLRDGLRLAATVTRVKPGAETWAAVRVDVSLVIDGRFSTT